MVCPQLLPFGPHRGGRLLCWDEDDGSAPAEKLPSGAAVAYKVDRRLHFFFGVFSERDLLETKPFKV